jgi:hypothetical protein
MNVPARILKITPPEVQEKVLLEISPFHSDGGERIGKAPADVPVEILSLYYREKNPLKALRARCLDCCCGSASEVRKCLSIGCPSWPFRMGKNPFRVRRQLSDEQKREMADRLGRRP